MINLKKDNQIYLQFENEQTCLLTLLFIAYNNTFPILIDLNNKVVDFDGVTYTLEVL